MPDTTRTRIAIASLLCAACGGASTTTSRTIAVTSVAPSHDAEATNDPVARFPVARARLVRQTFPPSASPEMYVLANGAVAFLESDGFYAVTDEALQLIKRGAVDRFDAHGFHDVDETGRYFVLPSGLFDASTETMRENSAGRWYAGCEPSLRRCVTLETNEDAWLRVRLEDAIAGTELDTFDITHAAVFGDGAANTQTPDLSTPPRAVIAGNFLGLTIRHANASLLLSYDVEHRAVLAYRAEVRGPTFEWLSADGTAALLVSQYRVSLVDPRTRMFPERAAADGYEVPNTSTDDLIVLRTARGYQAYERRTLAPVGEISDNDAIHVRGASGSAIVSRRDVRFLDRDAREIGTSSYAIREYSGPLVLSPMGLYLFEPSAWVRRINPDPAGVLTVPLSREVDRDFENVRVVAREAAFEITESGTTFSFGVGGVTTRAQTEDQAPNVYEVARQARSAMLARMSSTFPDRTLEVFAVAGPERRGATFAFLERGKAYVVDAEGHEVVRPVRLPSSVVRSDCSRLAFITDVDLALHGDAPCIPTRIRFREGRTEPLGRAYVDIDSTPDGSRVAMMADRKIHVLDGRTGATLLRFDPALEHPRTIEISDDGQEAQLSGDGMVLVSLRAVGTTQTQGAAVEPDVARYASRSVTYAEHDRRVVVCERGMFRIVTPFGGTPDIEASHPACVNVRGGSMWMTMPGFVATHSSPTGVIFVRLRDGALLEIETVATRERAAIIFVRGDDALGVVPDESPLVRFRSEDGQSVLPMPRGSEETSALVRAFFAPLPQ